jgi:cyclic pyranopterin phosphate synthase
MSESRLIDSFGRAISYLRISVTDVCNLRCVYCMPESQMHFLPSANLLSRSEIARLGGILVREGVRKIRLTGGEPLARPDIVDIARDLSSFGLPGGLALSTNGVLLPRCAEQLVEAGVDRVNISLDGVDAEHFRRMARRDHLDAVLQAIEIALALPFTKVKINTVVVRGFNDDQIVPLAERARASRVGVRFIEFMPYGDNLWTSDQYMPVEEIRGVLERRFKIIPIEKGTHDGPAVEFAVEGFEGTIGFISPISDRFCAGCNRMRLTSEGQLKACLFSTGNVDLRGPMRSGASDEELLAIIRRAVQNKEERHPMFPGMIKSGLSLPTRNMNTIGG